MRVYLCSNLIRVVCLFVLLIFTSQSTAMVMTGQSVHLTTFFQDKLEQAVNQYFLLLANTLASN